MKKLLWLSLVWCSLAIGARAQETPRNETKEPVEMLKNGDFEEVEEGAIAGWGGTPMVLSSPKQYSVSGERSLKLSSDKEGFDPIAAQDVKEFKHDQKYRLQYQARTEKLGQQYRLYVGVWDDTRETPDEKWLAGVDTDWRQGSGDWQKVSVDFTVAKPASRLMIVLQLKGPGAVWFDNVSLKEAVEKPDPAPLSPFVGSPDFVQIMPDKTFRVRGEPFFPILIWGWMPRSEEALQAAREMGFNVVSTDLIDSLGADGLRVWLDAAQKHDLMVNAIAFFSMPETGVETILPEKLEAMRKVIEANKDHPAIFDYGIADEPAWAGSSLEAFAAGAHLIRSIDPNRPIFVNHAPRNTIDELKKYNRYADIGGSDIYPVGEIGAGHHSDLPNQTIGVVGDETTKNLLAVDNQKPVIETLQAFGWADSNPEKADQVAANPFPTQEQLRFMTYHSIVRGATGAAFFQDHRYATLRPELKPIVRELRAMNDILAGGQTLPAQMADGPKELEWLVKIVGDKGVAIVVNPTEKTVHAKFALPADVDLGAGRALVLFENRSVAFQNGKFEDEFAPFSVHIYTNTETEKSILRPFLEPAAEVVAASEATPAWKVELEKLAPAGRENLALAKNGVKPISSSELAHMKATFLNDGDRWNAQWNDATHYTYPDWAGLEFPKPVTMGRIVIFSHEIPTFGQPAPDGIRDFSVQIEQNGEWKTVKVFKDNLAPAVAVDLDPPLSSDKVRVWITATNGANDWSRIREIEVYAPQ